MTETMGTVVVGLGGAVLGALLSLAASWVLTERQARVREDFEVRIRLLNSYQDFPNEMRQLITYQQQEHSELWEGALARCHKALNDAVLLDTRNPGRTQRMRALLDEVAGKRPLDTETVGAIDQELQEIFTSYLEDRAIAFWKRFS
jgi:hypothetical protein